jgi:hypothetical protein
MSKIFTHSDSVLPSIPLPTPCSVRVEITDRHLILSVGPRDWQWLWADGSLVGRGVSDSPPEPFDNPMLYL